MILQLRIDERLIHGQIAAAWGRALPINAIVCASDIAVNDPIRTKVLLMAAPPGIKARIKSTDDVIKLLSDPRADSMRILLITDSPVSALKLVQSLEVPEVNVANYHTKMDVNDRKIKIFETCVVDEEDLKAFTELAEASKEIYSQMVPSVEKRDFRSMLNSAQ
ncbi:MAG: PTS sugar transporter subunit IIB [Erysipelotrichaceae bacterium]|nr:PTS sugar transporter subunit IIB [Erysipelotrichaceae bacterium]